MLDWRVKAAGWLVVFLVGCGGNADVITTFPLTGTVTFDGQPVPAGTVTIMPDASANTAGPGAAVAINNGTFATEPGKGHTGGKYIVQVVGYDGIPVASGEGDMNPMGTQLFPPYDVETDLPTGPHTIAIDVPRGS